ncbi:hypothetical protein ABENE_13670 [Asticcacaulis benevestitus DSM 16100 = ATCC BAA-896]|uniref:Non-canonical purine NTP pyrophosphatase n=2 Tax=Asticcacaulis TaxID=76890 RepID=V4PNF4_9CAUL|nr:hypothetical protein ABENE_13670 [Asticcacaulis benevestitus DSM 16100 = ATCC BAA-896]
MLGRPVEAVAIDLTEIQALDTKSVSLFKAKEAYQRLQRTVIVDDTSLGLVALNGFPGALITWALKAGGNEILHRMLPPGAAPDALISTSIGYCDGERTEVVTGEVKGTVSQVSRGANGFGFDSIFIPEGESRTLAEMPDAEKDALSSRRLAIDALRVLLTT